MINRWDIAGLNSILDGASEIGTKPELFTGMNSFFDVSSFKTLCDTGIKLGSTAIYWASITAGLAVILVECVALCQDLSRKHPSLERTEKLVNILNNVYKPKMEAERPTFHSLQVEQLTCVKTHVESYMNAVKKLKEHIATAQKEHKERREMIIKKIEELERAEKTRDEQRRHNEAKQGENSPQNRGDSQFSSLFSWVSILRKALPGRQSNNASGGPPDPNWNGSARGCNR